MKEAETKVGIVADIITIVKTSALEHRKIMNINRRNKDMNGLVYITRTPPHIHIHT